MQKNINYYYGVIQNNFSWYTNSDIIKHNIKVIELPEEEISSEEAFKSMCFDCDCMMNAIEI